MASRSWGVSPSTFLGREPKTVTSQGYNGATVAYTESSWTNDDRDAALDLMAWEAAQCPGCGLPLSETTKPESEFRWRAGLPIRCHRCTAISMGSESAQEHEHPTALLIPVEERS